jgi:hypothetical protein
LEERRDRNVVGCREREKDMTESRLKGGFVLKRGDFFFFGK